jgi:hypothetical protein
MSSNNSWERLYGKLVAKSDLLFCSAEVEPNRTNAYQSPIRTAM